MLLRMHANSSKSDRAASSCRCIEIANHCRRTSCQELLDHRESTIYIPLCTCSGGKLLLAGKF